MRSSRLTMTSLLPIAPCLLLKADRTFVQRLDLPLPLLHQPSRLAAVLDQPLATASASLGVFSVGVAEQIKIALGGI